ncbi:MAG: hypothetical protein ACKVW3_04120 [Phycisphaerales bacterium]
MTHADPAELLARQHALLIRLDALGRRQASLLNHDDTSLLLDVIAEREDVMEELRPLADELAQAREAWSRPDSPAASHLHRLATQCAELAAAVALRDREHGSRLAQRRDALASELARIELGRDATAAYGERAPLPRFQDRHA